MRDQSTDPVSSEVKTIPIPRHLLKRSDGGEKGEREAVLLLNTRPQEGPVGHCWTDTHGESVPTCLDTVGNVLGPMGWLIAPHFKKGH